MNARFLRNARTQANIALYGTIGLCGYTSLQSFSTRANLALASKNNDRKGWADGLKRMEQVNQHLVCSRKNLSEGRYYTLITSIWNHGSGIHFLGNMLGLWSFGRLFAYGFGVRTFMTIFYGGGIVGNLLCLGLDKRMSKRDDSLGKDNRQGGFIGASGGVCALTAANACINPLGTMIIGIMFIPVPVPNALGALGFAGFSAWAQTNNFQSGVAHLGHLGGLVYGVLWFAAKYRGFPVFR